MKAGCLRFLPRSAGIARAALKFLKPAMKRYGRPHSIVTDRLRSYRAALNVIGNGVRQETKRWLNNRAENSHQPFRRREGAMARFRDVKTLQKFAAVQASIHNHFNHELGFVPLSKTGAELPFEVFSQRYERGSIVITSNLPFDEWTEIFASERLTGALLDRLTHHVHILEMNGDSYRLNQSRRKQQTAGRS